VRSFPKPDGRGMSMIDGFRSPMGEDVEGEGGDANNGNHD